MPLNDPYLGHPLFVVNPVYEFEVTEGVDSSVRLNPFQSGFTVRNEESSRKRRTFTIVFKTVKVGIMNDLERFYRNLSGPLEPFWFKPPIELVNGRYTQVVSDGSQKLEDFESDLLRAGDQSVLVRFTQPFNRVLFTPGLERASLVLEEVFGEEDAGKYIEFDGLSKGQYAVIPDHEQDFLDLGTKDFMIDFMIRGETIFISTAASYAALTGLTLIFTIAATPYTVTFSGDAVDAATVCQEINDQVGDEIECQVFGTTELKIRTLIDSGFFAISGTAFAQLDLSDGIIFPITKRVISNLGYEFRLDNPTAFKFAIDDGVTDKNIFADSSFHALDGSWHYIAVVCDRSADGQMYVDGLASGSAVDISTANLSLDNTADFFLNSDDTPANQGNFQIARVGIWSWDAGSLPADMPTKIANLLDSWQNRHSIDVADEDGLQVLYAFDKENGDDSRHEEDLTLVNSPSFWDYDQ